MEYKKLDYWIIPKSDILENSDNLYTDLFVYKNIVQAFNSDDKSSTLYIQLENQDYHPLYDYSDELKQLFTPKGVFCIPVDIDEQEAKESEITCFIDRENYLDYLDLNWIYLNSNSNLDLIKLEHFYSSNSNIVQCSNGTILDNDLYKEFTNNRIRYEAANSLIPSLCSIQTSLNLINKYIATGKLESDSLDRCIQILESDNIHCTSSANLLNHFIKSPQNMDLRDLTEKLNRYKKNIENLIEMYLENELKYFEEKTK